MHGKWPSLRVNELLNLMVKTQKQNKIIHHYQPLFVPLLADGFHKLLSMSILHLSCTCHFCYFFNVISPVHFWCPSLSPSTPWLLFCYSFCPSSVIYSYYISCSLSFNFFFSHQDVIYSYVILLGFISPLLFLYKNLSILFWAALSICLCLFVSDQNN